MVFHNTNYTKYIQCRGNLLVHQVKPNDRDWVTNFTQSGKILSYFATEAEALVAVAAYEVTHEVMSACVRRSSNTF